MASTEPRLDLDDVRRVFPPGRVGRRSPVEDTGASPSAILVAFYMDGPAGGEELHVILTRRAWGLRTHAGEVAFPGGRCDLGETYAEAAVREAWEETALAADSVEVLGELDHLTTVTRRAFIVPVVAVIADRPQLEANPSEVDRVLRVPVAELLRPELFREEQWGEGDQHRPIYFFELMGDTLWGATAAILRQCLAMLVGVDPGTLADLDPSRVAPKGYRLAAGYHNSVV